MTKYVRARSLVAALTLGAGVALSAVTASVPSATARELSPGPASAREAHAPWAKPRTNNGELQ